MKTTPSIVAQMWTYIGVVREIQKLHPLADYEEINRLSKVADISLDVIEMQLQGCMEEKPALKVYKPSTRIITPAFVGRGALYVLGAIILALVACAAVFAATWLLGLEGGGS